MAGNQFKLFSNTEQLAKVCCRCRAGKPKSEFYLRYIGPRGPHYRSKCKKCEWEIANQWREAKRDELNQRRRELYRASEKYKGHARGWYQRNKSYFIKYRETPENRKRMRETERQRVSAQNAEQKAKRLLRQKQSKANHPETMRAYRQRMKDHAAKLKREWIKKNPHKVAEYEIARRARKACAPYEKIDRAAIIRRDKSTCYLCGKKLEQKQIHLDHVIPLSRGGSHTAANLRVACASCNYAKARRTPEEYAALIAIRFH